MFNPEIHALVDAERRKDEMAQAAQYRLLNNPARQPSLMVRMTYRALEALGSLLVAFGGRLRERYALSSRYETAVQPVVDNNPCVEPC